MDSFNFVYPLLCTLVACLVSMGVIVGHLVYYNDKNLQKYIIRILFIIPIYAVTSFLAIQTPENELYYSAIRDFYEAYVLYSFIQLLI